MKKRISIFLIIFVVVLSVTAVTVYGLTLEKAAWVPDPAQNLPNPTYTFNTVMSVDGTKSMEYLLQMPRVRNFDSGGVDSKIKYPLIIYLHGSGAEDYIARYKTEVMPDGLLLDHLNKSYEFPFITINPLLPKWAYGDRHSWLNVKDLVMKALADTIKNYPVDTDRIYLTGFSLGGYGTYDYALAYPNIFAACVVAAGSHETKNAPRLANIPFWVFHGIRDFTVSYDEDKAMAEELQYQTSDSSVNFTSLAVGHELTAEIYSETTFNWMLSKKLRVDTTAPVIPDVNVVYSYSSKITGSISDELGSKVLAKVGDKVLGTGYVDIHGEFSINISKQAVGTKVSVMVEDAFKNVGSAKDIVVKLNPIPSKPIIKTISTIKITGTAEARCTIFVKSGSSTIASGNTTSTGTFSLKYKTLKKGTTIKVTSVRNKKSSPAVSVKV